MGKMNSRPQRTWHRACLCRAWLAATLLVALSWAPRVVHALELDGGTDGALGDGGVADAGPNAQKPSVALISQVTPSGDVVRGSPVTVTGTGFPKDVRQVSLTLGTITIEQPLSIAADGKSLMFLVPADAKLGTTLLRVSIKAAPAFNGMAAAPYAAGYLHVVSEQRPALKLTGVEPAVVTGSTDHIVLEGEGLGGRGDDYALLRDGREMPLCWDKCDAAPVASDPDAAPVGRTYKARFTSLYQLEIDGPFDHTWDGPHTLSLRRGDAIAEGKLGEVRFTTWKPESTRGLALTVSAVLLAIILAIGIWGGPDMTDPATGRAHNGLASFIIDAETGTYSLSKCQLYAWTISALVAYVYLCLSRGLAQGRLDIADIPANLPSILALSLATAVGSTGVSIMRGPKAAGPASPTFSDLISSGGVVAADRVQLALWTLVAISVFMFSVIRADPTSINGLPAIPDGLLQLSTISAAGYLGGKLVRAPGPIVDQILTRIGSFELTIMGRNMSKDATVTIGGISVADYLDPSKHPDARPRALDPDKTTGLAKTLIVLLSRAASTWETADALEITVENDDGQKATWSVQLDAAAKEQLAALSKVPPTRAQPATPAATGSIVAAETATLRGP